VGRIRYSGRSCGPFDPDWIAAYRITSTDVPRPGRDDTIWVIDVPDADVATVSDWCSPFPGRHGFHPSAFRGQAVQQPLVLLAAFPDAWDPEVADLDLSQVDPVLALMVTMRTGTLNDAGDLPDGCKPRLLTAAPDDVPTLAELALTGAAETRPSLRGSEIRHMRGLRAAPGVPAVPGISPVQPLERTMHGMRRLVHTRPRSRPWIVVVGDTCADFCFTLACDRLIGGATSSFQERKSPPNPGRFRKPCRSSAAVRRSGGVGLSGSQCAERDARVVEHEADLVVDQAAGEAKGRCGVVVALVAALVGGARVLLLQPSDAEVAGPHVGCRG
jgi:hypothetical protein